MKQHRLDPEEVYDMFSKYRNSQEGAETEPDEVLKLREETINLISLHRKWANSINALAAKNNWLKLQQKVKEVKESLSSDYSAAKKVA